MTGNGDVDGRDSDDDVTAADRQALAAMFASLSADPPESDFSPLRLVQLGKAEQRTASDSRIKRFKVLRNVLVAAAVAAVVVLVVPHLIPATSPGQASASSSSSSAASSAVAGQAPDAAAGSAANSFGGNGSSAGSGETKAAASSAASSGAASAGSSSASAPTAAAAPGSSATDASSAASASSAAASEPASSAPAATSRSANSTGSSTHPAQVCSAMPSKAIGAVRSSFPDGYFGSPAKDTGCALYGLKLPAAEGGGPYLAVDVTRAKSGACLTASEGAPCARKPGSTDTYVLTLPGGETDVWVYGGGYEVYLRVDGDFRTQPTTTQLAAAGHAVVKALGP